MGFKFGLLFGLFLCFQLGFNFGLSFGLFFYGLQVGFFLGLQQGFNFGLSDSVFLYGLLLGFNFNFDLFNSGFFGLYFNLVDLNDNKIDFVRMLLSNWFNNYFVGFFICNGFGLGVDLCKAKQNQTHGENVYHDTTNSSGAF